MENEDCYLTRHPWHEWQRRSWRDCHKSRQREQDIGRRIWSRESYSRNIHYKGANISQLVSLINVPQQREQFIKYECLDSTMHDAFWVSRESIGMNYRGEQLLIQIVLWSGTCGMNNTCARKKKVCNCLTGERNWHENSGLLIEKTYLPVKQLRLGDTGTNGISNIDEKGYHT